MKFLSFLFVLVLSLAVAPVASFAAAEAGSPGKFVPPAGRTLLIVGQDRDTIEEYVEAMGVVPGGFMTYTSIQELKGLSSATNYGSGWEHAQYFVDKYPDSVLQIGLYMVGALKDVSRGVYDENIRKLGEWIKAAKRPVFLRIGYEFDNPTNYYDPEDYKAAYRYLVDKLRAAGVENAAFVWHTYAPVDLKDIMAWYPGDEYVDWFAVSFFATYQKDSAEKVVKLAREHAKPMMIAEAAPSGVKNFRREEIFGRWLSTYFDLIQDNQIEIACYIDSDWESMPMYKGQGWGDSRLELTPKIKEQWLKEIKSGRYLNAGQNLFSQLGYKSK